MKISRFIALLLAPALAFAVPAAKTSFLINAMPEWLANNCTAYQDYIWDASIDGATVPIGFSVIQGTIVLAGGLLTTSGNASWGITGPAITDAANWSVIIFSVRGIIDTNEANSTPVGAFGMGINDNTSSFPATLRGFAYRDNVGDGPWYGTGTSTVDFYSQVQFPIPILQFPYNRLAPKDIWMFICNKNFGPFVAGTVGFGWNDVVMYNMPAPGISVANITPYIFGGGSQMTTGFRSLELLKIK